MPDGACILFTVVDHTVAASDRRAHVAGARQALGDAAVVAELEGVAGSRSVIACVGRSSEALAEARAQSPLTDVWHVVCGVDPDAIADDTARPAEGYVDLVLDPAEPPIPFDDPVVVGVFRDYQRSYLSLLGRRYLCCHTLWHDGVRAAGAFVAFTADDARDGQWLAAANPWRRIAPGLLLRLPPGLLRTTLPPPGPGTQRSSHFPCPPTSTSPEPGVDRRRPTG